MEQLLEPLKEYAPYLIPIGPFLWLLFYFRRVQKELVSENITVQGLQTFLSVAAMHLPKAAFVELKDGRTAVKISDISQDAPSTMLLQIICRQDKLKNRVDALTNPIIVQCFGLLVIVLLAIMFALRPQQPLAGILIVAAFVVGVFVYLVISNWDFRVRADMKFLQEHITRTPLPVAESP